jgi:uncharacterized protein YndB with AHSA1/START domain
MSPAVKSAWYAPNGLRLVSYEVDFADEGQSRLRLLAPDGREHRVEGVSLELVEPERIVVSCDQVPALEGAPARVTFRRE